MNRRYDLLSDWLDWQQKLHPKNIDFKIERIKSVYKRLNIKKVADKIIIVAGTNGKGSTVAILESILHSSGKKVGSFTSPHILDYNERIKISKLNVSDTELVEAFEIIDNLRGETTLTYFEFATLAAFLIFSKKKLDYVILEVGLGGRLDATNIIDSDLSIITSIGIDHTEFLGSSIESIANEKAGVMRPFHYSIYADSHPPSAITTYAKKNKVNLLTRDSDFSYFIYDNHWVWKSKKGLELKLPLLPLIGDFQYNHAAAALQGLELLDDSLLMSYEELCKGINDVTLLGRFQIWSKTPEIILDVAHNEDSAKKLFINIEKRKKRRTFAVIGLLKDKDVYSLIRPLTPIVENWFIGTISSERGMNSSEIKERMRGLVDSKLINCYHSMQESFENAINFLRPGDRLVIYGSFYTVSEFLDFSLNSQLRGMK